MKKLISLFLVILILCALSSCAVTSPDESQGDTATLATAGASSQAAPPSELPSDSDKAEADNAAAVPDHDSLLRNLGALAVSGGWADPGDVSAEDLLIWFGSRALQNFSGDMSQYEVEGKDCLYFPCFVFESEVTKFFGINASSLRDGPAYNAETMKYASPIKKYEPIDADYEIIRVEIENGHDVVYFNLTVDGKPVGERILTIDMNGDVNASVFRSYTYGDGAVSVKAPKPASVATEGVAGSATDGVLED